MTKIVSRWLERVATEEDQVSDFDAAFYTDFYDDLRGMDPARARQHYRHHGREEGRFANPAAYISYLEVGRKPLPPEFDAKTYRALNRDLATLFKDWQLAEHFIRYGEREGRRFKFECELTLTAEDIKALCGRDYAFETDVQALVTEMLAKSGLPAGVWLTRFVLLDFTLLNRGWLEGAQPCLVEALRLFASEGVRRLAPIARGLAFDPAFYRSEHPDLAAQSDADLYRHWLLYGMQEGEEPSEASFLDVTLGLSEFPTCFDERRYRVAARKVGRDVALGRSAALRDFVAHGFAAGLALPSAGAEAAAFYEAVGDYHLVRGNAAAARDAFDLAISSGSGSGPLLHKRGDARLALGDKTAALADFELAAAQPNAGLWSFLHAAQLQGEHGDLESAFSTLRQSSEEYGHLTAWRNTGHDLLRVFFDDKQDKARALYRAGDRAAGDNLLEGASGFVAQTLPWLDPLPSLLPPCVSRLVIILANRDLPQCDHYRVTQKRQQLEHAGWQVEIYEKQQTEAFRAALTRAGQAIFYRLTATPPVIHAILTARALGVPTAYEIDDLIFDAACYPEPLADFAGKISQEQYVGLLVEVPLVRFAIRLCDVGLASTPALAQAMRPFVRSGECHILRNGLDHRNAHYFARRRVGRQSSVTLFYGSGTQAHNRDFADLLAPALIDAFARHPHMRLVTAGHVHLDRRFGPYLDRIHRFEFDADLDAYWEVLALADINLSVLSPGAMTDAKSEIKWLEAAMFGIPSIVSATRTYREVLRDGVNARLAATADEWRDALDSLIGSALLRDTIGERARQTALEQYGLDAAASQLQAWLGDPPEGCDPVGAEGSGRALAFAQPQPHERRRIMIVNVFQPPALIGGATRVMRENIDFLIDHASDWLDLVLVAADDMHGDPRLTRVDRYRDVPVFRIPIAAAAEGDWKPFDAAVEEQFGEILDRTAPDLIHFHCVQKLSASVVRAAQQRDLPYVISLHDAWWISDYQFLCDSQGRIQWPSPDPILASPPLQIGKMASVARRAGLSELLRGARAVLAVSDALTDIYRSAGEASVRTLSNGCPKIPITPRTTTNGSRLRMGYLGGRGLHKGGSLVEIAFRDGRFANIDLTVVDDARSANYQSLAVWGTTPVRILGRLHQHRMPDLYAGLDVLLAPSIWPESYGLVAREAKQAGLWIVASDRGAMGQEVRNGVDGFIVDVSSLDGLASALAAMDRDPGAILRQVRPAVPARTSEDQGAELLTLYSDLLGQQLCKNASSLPKRTWSGARRTRV
ncbi:glycosyltransferase [Methylobacterium tardum]|uniref:Glycosyl transferase family 1 n=1 Tax=Methylobacterium tardum TaxID=374432 RepID=A0AA37WQM9_9HYPH|nr:glycosyltransferase [Methylobacterium tardum]GLS67992.1 hypothetical protein GCM10007890_00030 [Methylobacterium tardum]